VQFSLGGNLSSDGVGADELDTKLQMTVCNNRSPSKTHLTDRISGFRGCVRALLLAGE
jgi:hypothetical protein